MIFIKRIYDARENNNLEYDTQTLHKGQYTNHGYLEYPIETIT